VADSTPEPESDARPPLPDWAVVVRGGVATKRLVGGAITKNRLQHGTYAASVWSFPGFYAEEIVRIVRALNPGDLPHRQMQTSTVGALRGLGLEVARTMPDKPGHYSVTFPSAPSSTDIEAFIQAFSAPRRTPPQGGDNVSTTG
jgi:hypothetical protein